MVKLPRYGLTAHAYADLTGLMMWVDIGPENAQAKKKLAEKLEIGIKYKIIDLEWDSISGKLRPGKKHLK